jgi:hypothetical protein
MHHSPTLNPRRSSNPHHHHHHSQWYQYPIPRFVHTIKSVLGRPLNALLVLTALIIFIYTANIWKSNEITSNISKEKFHNSNHETCVWSEGDPQLFHLKTSSGVHYDGGHWFHVAENFMVQHTLMRQRQVTKGIGLATSSDVYLSLDREAFLGESNSMTRFMLGLGLTNGLFNFLHFVHVPTLGLSHTSAKPGDSIFMHHKSITSHKVGFFMYTVVVPFLCAQCCYNVYFLLCRFYIWMSRQTYALRK